MHEIEDVDLLVVGGGKAGKSLALDRAKAGWTVAMVEHDKIGGTCINVACIPTKALVASARTLITARRAGELGVEVGGEPAVVLDRLRAHKQGVVGGMVVAHAQLFTGSGMDFLMGTARFVAERTVEVELNGSGTRTIRGREVVIDTGTTPALPDLPGLAQADPWTSESILHLERLPESILILGGGYVGCEFASMLAVFGTRVTVIQRASRLLPREDPDVATAVAELLTGQGVDIRLAAQTTAVRREGERGVVVLTLSDGTEVGADELLVATGRRPVTADLEAEKAGVDIDAGGFIVVDEHLRTTAEHVWAAGDVAGSPQFTHASWNDFRIIKANLTGGDAVTTGRLMPYTVFVTPELARIGLTETQARAEGRAVTVARLDVAAIPRAKTLRETAGHWKVLIDDATDEILGAALLGHESGEVLAAVQMAMLGHLPYQRLRDAAITHPTMAEGLNLLFDTVAKQAPA